MLASLKKKYVAPASFYRRVGVVAIPIALQQILNQAAGFVDTIMVSSIGGVAAVAVATQLDTIMANVGFGINSGASIYAAQFYGAEDYQSLKKVFGLEIMINMINALFFMAVAIFFGSSVLAFYSGDAEVVKVGLSYLSISCLAYVFSSLTNAYSFVYRSIQKTHIPMYLGIQVMIVNIIFNYLLIFGKFGFPAMGVAGAALATLIATVSGTCTHVIYAWKTKQPFLGTFQEMFHQRMSFVKPVVKRMFPLICNEAFFGFGTSLYVKAFGMLGSRSLEIYKIGNTVANFFFIFAAGLNNATSLMLGSVLGKGDIKEAQKYGNYFVLMACIFAVVAGVGIIVFADPMVGLFGMSDPSMHEGAVLIVRLFAIRIAFRMFNVIIMASLRAGGDSLFLMFLDGGIMWTVGLPLAFISIIFFHVTSYAVLFVIIQVEQLARLIVGIIRYRQGKWMRNLTEETK